MLAGDSNPWRDIGHARWYDPHAILEDPHSGAFKEAVKEETTRWAHALKPLRKSVIKWEKGILRFTKEALPHTQDYAHEQMAWNGYTVKIQHTFGHRMNVWITDNDNKPAHTFMNINNFGVCPEKDLFYTIVDVGNGAESLELAVYRVSRKRPLWKTGPVGPGAAFSGNRIVYQTVENQLRYPGIQSAHDESGKRIHTIYHESDKRKQVELCPCKSGIFVRVMNALDQRIGKIVGSPERISWIKHSNQTLYPVSDNIYVSNNSIHVLNNSYAFPCGHIVDAVETDACVYVTTSDRSYVSLYAFHPDTGTFTTLVSPDCPNEIDLCKYSRSVIIKQPQKSSSVYLIAGHELVLYKKFPEPLAIPYFQHGFATSKDGSRVPYTVVSSVKHPKKLLVEGYGAYGISAHRSYPIRWLQWLVQGYALAVAMPRGGREDGDMWYDGGRTAVRKQNTFDDSAAVIQKVQSLLRIKKTRTVFYGRSAGGLLAANIAQQFPQLVGAVYAEVPYLDVLRTTSNPALPLTQLEYDEFGDPIRRPVEYKALQRISPVDTVPVAPHNSPLVIVKTAVNDTQVLPYESLKWSKKLRANGWNVYVGIDGAGGHFAEESSMVQQQAEDAALIDMRIQGVSSGTRRASRSHVSRGTTRRRTSS